MHAVLGIDFGTTNTSAAWFDQAGKLRVVPVTDKTAMLPSVVWFPSADASKCLVGQAAKTQLVDDPKHTLFGTKRFIGRRYDEVEAERKIVPYKVVRGPAGDKRKLNPIAFEIIN